MSLVEVIYIKNAYEKMLLLNTPT